MIFDKYFIGQNYSEIDNELSEISKEEYSVLKPFFSDEKIFHGKQINFCDQNWTTVLGITQGKVYKLSLQTQTTQKNYDISSKGLWNKVYERLNEEYEIYTDQQKINDSFITTWDTKFGNIILNNTTLPNENIFSQTSEVILDITLTGSFAFGGTKRAEKIGLSIFLLAGLTISQFVSPGIAVIIFLLLGLMFGRKFDYLISNFFLKGTIKKGYVFFICLLWGTTIALSVRELFLHYNPNIVMKIIFYGAGFYLSNVFFQDNRINSMAELIYGKNFKSGINTVTVIANILSSIAFNFILK